MASPTDLIQAKKKEVLIKTKGCSRPKQVYRSRSLKAVQGPKRFIGPETKRLFKVQKVCRTENLRTVQGPKIVYYLLDVRGKIRKYISHPEQS